MKTLQKVLLILVMAVCVCMIMPKNVSLAAGEDALDIVSSVEPENPSSETSSALTSIINRLLGFLQVLSGLVAIIMIAWTGFNYITATPELKSELQKKFLPIIVGLILVFGAVSVAKFILGVVGLG